MNFLREDEEDEEDDELELAETDIHCTQCEDPLHLTEEVFLLRIIRPYVEEGRHVHEDVLDGNGNFKHPPAFFCFTCWEEEQENLETIQEDVPPVADPRGILLCDICRSDILEEESVALLQFGELHLSQRAPNHKHSPTFVELDSGKHICTACLTHLEDTRTDPIWSEDIEPTPNVSVCIEGIFSRCWRYGTCTCPQKR